MGTPNKTIVALSDYEHVLARPEMYVGSVSLSEEKLAIIKEEKVVWENKEISVGFYKLANEILDNAFDEAKRMNGKMKSVEIHLSSKNNSVKVIDTGDGFIHASEINPKTEVTNVETAMSFLRAGSNFQNEGTNQNLIGTNGVGAAVVNMLSEIFTIRTINEDEIFEQTWKRFQTDGPKITKQGRGKKKLPTGTEITFTPLRSKFKCKWDKDLILSIMNYKHFLNKNDPEISKLKFDCYFDGEKLNLEIPFIPKEHISVSNRYGTFILWESYQNSANLSFVNGAHCTGVHQRIFGEHVNNIFGNPIAGRFYEYMIILN